MTSVGAVGNSAFDRSALIGLISGVNNTFLLADHSSRCLSHCHGTGRSDSGSRTNAGTGRDVNVLYSWLSGNDSCTVRFVGGRRVRCGHVLDLAERCLHSSDRAWNLIRASAGHRAALSVAHHVSRASYTVSEGRFTKDLESG